MFKTSAMPTNVNEITTDWLTAVLRGSGAIGMETAVVEFSIEHLSEAGYVGLVARIKPAYETPTADCPTSLIFKYSSPDPGLREGLQGLYAREVRVYQELSDQIELPMPTCYHADFDANTGHSVLLLEDLAHLRQGTIANGCNERDIKTVCTQLAKHHA